MAAGPVAAAGKRLLVSSSPCGTCHTTPSKYRCPGCLVTSCCLACVTSHKKRTACSGQRPVTHFIPLDQFNRHDLLSDYRFLEQVERSFYGKKWNRMVHSSQMYPVPADFLRRGAFKRGVKLKFLPMGMLRRKMNSSMFNRSSDTLSWRLEWRFPLSDQAKYVDRAVPDSRLIRDVLNAYISSEAPADVRQRLKKYVLNWERVHVLMSNEFASAAKRRYFDLPLHSSIRDALVGKTVVEHPVFTVTLDEFLPRYKLIGKDESEELRQQMIDRRLSRFTFNSRRDGQDNICKKEALQTYADLPPSLPCRDVKTEPSAAGQPMSAEEEMSVWIDQLDSSVS